MMADGDETMAFAQGLAWPAQGGVTFQDPRLPPRVVLFGCAGGRGNQTFWESPVDTKSTSLKFGKIQAAAGSTRCFCPDVCITCS